MAEDALQENEADGKGCDTRCIIGLQQRSTDGAHACCEGRVRRKVVGGTVGSTTEPEQVEVARDGGMRT
jgi:hypothetical protein